VGEPSAWIAPLTERELRAFVSVLYAFPPSLRGPVASVDATSAT
jgi:hypothetical protein